MDALKQGCEYEQQRQKLFKADYIQSLEYLEICAAISTSVATFTNALELFQNGASALAVHSALSKYQKFKAALPRPPKPEFAVPTTLPKKRTAEKDPIAPVSPPKRQAQSILNFKVNINAINLFIIQGLPKEKKIMEEEETAEACLSNHGSAIVAIAGISLSSCSMSGGFHQVGEGGFKCTVCPDTH
jgi:hypothetical protein